MICTSSAILVPVTICYADRFIFNDRPHLLFSAKLLLRRDESDFEDKPKIDETLAKTIGQVSCMLDRTQKNRIISNSSNTE
jgi:hypothetical protein